MKNKRTIILIFAAAMSFIGGVQFSVMKYSMEEIRSPIVFLWARFLFAYLSAVIYAKIKRIKLLKDKKVMILSLIHPFFAFYLQSVGTAMAEVTVVSVITALFPAISTLMAFLSGTERLTPKEWFAVTGIVAGGIIAAVFGRGVGNFFSYGAVLMLGAIILRGVYYVMAHNMTKGISPYELSYSQITYAFMFYSIMLILSGEFSYDELAGLSGAGYLSLIYMGVVSTTVAYFMNNYLLSNISVSLNGSISAVTFIISLFAAWLINGESINGGIVAGSIIVIISIVILAREKGFKNNQRL